MAHTTTTQGTQKPTTPSYGSQVARKEDLRLTRMMLTIFLFFLITFLPLMIVNVADDDVRYIISIRLIMPKTQIEMYR